MNPFNSALTDVDKIAEEINKVIVKTAIELGIGKGKRVRMDSTGVESNIHYPTDGELLPARQVILAGGIE